jgi:Glycosyl hydrolases family 28
VTTVNIILKCSLAAFAFAFSPAALGQVPASKEIAPLLCDVTRYGAVANDSSMDTAAAQSAIDACAGHGGRVVVPAGRFVVGQLQLRSTMELHLAAGAVLQASTNLNDFPVSPVLSEDGTHRPFIIGAGVRDVAVTGLGTIDGSGPVYWEAVRLPGYRDTELAPDADERRMRFGLVFQGCNNVKVRDITIRDTPMFLMGVMDCDNVVVDGITLQAPTDSPNTDGLQIIDSNDVRVSNCLIDVGDDGIVTKARKRVIERLQVVNCRISSDDGAIKFGTRSSSGVRDSLFSNIAITGSRFGIALFMIHGGVYENNRFDNIRIATGGRHRRNYPIYIDVDDRADRPEDQGRQQRLLGVIRGLTFDGIDITTAGNILIGGHPRSMISDLTLSNIRMRVSGAQDLAATSGKPKGNRKLKPVPGSPDHSGVNAHIVLGHVKDATLSQVDVRGLTAADNRPLLAIPNSTGIKGSEE